jgi:hypothetical protein
LQIILGRKSIPSPERASTRLLRRRCKSQDCHQAEVLFDGRKVLGGAPGQAGKAKCMRWVGMGNLPINNHHLGSRRHLETLVFGNHGGPRHCMDALRSFCELPLSTHPDQIRLPLKQKRTIQPPPTNTAPSYRCSLPFMAIRLL